jgi:hypothetical protein
LTRTSTSSFVSSELFQTPNIFPSPPILLAWEFPNSQRPG